MKGSTKTSVFYENENSNEFGLFMTPSNGITHRMNITNSIMTAQNNMGKVVWKKPKQFLKLKSLNDVNTPNPRMGDILTWTGTNWESKSINFNGFGNINGISDVIQFFKTDNTGKDFNITSLGNTHKFSIPSASSSTRGLLEPRDWTLFNSKLSNSLPCGHFYIGNNLNKAESCFMSGDAVLLANGILSLVDIGVSPGTYSNPTITVDSKGRITNVENTLVTSGNIKPSGKQGSLQINNLGTLHGLDSIVYENNKLKFSGSDIVLNKSKIHGSDITPNKNVLIRGGNCTSNISENGGNIEIIGGRGKTSDGDIVIGNHDVQENVTKRTSITLQTGNMPNQFNMGSNIKLLTPTEFFGGSIDIKSGRSEDGTPGSILLESGAGGPCCKDSNSISLIGGNMWNRDIKACGINLESGNNVSGRNCGDIKFTTYGDGQIEFSVGGSDGGYKMILPKNDRIQPKVDDTLYVSHVVENVAQLSWGAPRRDYINAIVLEWLKINLITEQIKFGSITSHSIDYHNNTFKLNPNKTYSLSATMTIDSFGPWDENNSSEELNEDHAVNFNFVQAISQDELDINTKLSIYPKNNRIPHSMNMIYDTYNGNETLISFNVIHTMEYHIPECQLSRYNSFVTIYEI